MTVLVGGIPRDRSLSRGASLSNTGAHAERAATRLLDDYCAQWTAPGRTTPFDKPVRVRPDHRDRGAGTSRPRLDETLLWNPERLSKMRHVERLHGLHPLLAGVQHCA